MATKPQYEVPYEIITDPLVILKHLHSLPTTVTFQPVLIGSRALHHYLPQYKTEEFAAKYTHKDYDLIVDVASALQIMPKEHQFTRRYNHHRQRHFILHNDDGDDPDKYVTKGPDGFYVAKLTILKVPSKIVTTKVIKQPINPQDIGKTYTIGSRVIPATIKYHNVEVQTFNTNTVDKYRLYISCDQGALDMEIVTTEHDSGYLIAVTNQTTPVINKSIYTNNDVTIHAHVASMATLEAIKTSHIFHPINFSKHIVDLHVIRRYLALTPYERGNIGDYLPGIIDVNSRQPGPVPTRHEMIQKIMDVRRTEINIVKGVPGAHINLKMDNDDFLETAGTLLVEKMIKHDDIHTMVKFNTAPMYTYLKEDQSQAMCLQPLFEALLYTQQCQCVMEEAMVLALERYLLPEYKRNQQEAYSLALTRVCTTITKGWFRLFAVNNWPAVSECPRPILDFAHGIIGKYQQSKDAENAITYATPLPDLQTYFNDDEIEVAITLASHIEEIILEDATIEVVRPHVNESDSDDSPTESDDDTPIDPIDTFKEPNVNTPIQTPLKKWKNKGRHQRTKTNLDDYANDDDDYHHPDTDYDFPATERVFRLHENQFTKEMWIKVTTDHSFSCADCSESLNWTGSIIVTPAGPTRKESLLRIETDNFNLKYENQPQHSVILTITSYCSKGGSDGNDTGASIKVEETGTFRYPAAVLRVILGLLNPHMLPAGESLLATRLANTNVNYNFPSGQHPLFVAYMTGRK
jgi:hypothetical protein